MTEGSKKNSSPKQGDLPQDPATSPWQTKSHAVVYDNPWIAVSHRDVITPGGDSGQYGVVHYKNKAIGIVPLTTAGKLIMVKQFRYPLGMHCIEIPAGGCPEPVGDAPEPAGGAPEKEAPLATAKRELEEETGFRSDNWQLIAKMHLSNSISDEQAEIFLATDIEQTGEAALESTEADLEVLEISFKEALAMIDRFEITDSLSVAGILQAARHLQLD